MKQRPGFMLYFELVGALGSMEDAEAGRLLKALMAYAQYGEVQELTGLAAFAFEVVRPRIDRDNEAYQEKCRKSAYAAYVRDVQRQGESPLEYEDWCGRPSDDIGRYPTRTTTTTTTTIPTTASNTNTVSNKISNAVFNKTATADGRKPDSRSEASAVDSDTSWVLPYLEECRQNKKRSLAR